MSDGPRQLPVHHPELCPLQSGILLLWEPSFLASPGGLRYVIVRIQFWTESRCVGTHELCAHTLILGAAGCCGHSSKQWSPFQFILYLHRENSYREFPALGWMYFHQEVFPLPQRLNLPSWKWMWPSMETGFLLLSLLTPPGAAEATLSRCWSNFVNLT